MRQVTAAVIEKDGKILIAQRKLGDTLAGKWEFPGGKLEPGETPEACLKRELMEEFGVETAIGEFICSSKFEYKHLPIELLVYRAQHLSGEYKLNDHDRIAWVTSAELVNYDFSSADIPVVNLLVSASAKN
ncbi:MAG: NUDIX hydrolase [Elusimicrobia bacterium GWA2_61_42]|nr:MAG: NUDIX hydrolase [Elusimicrobia bacterium GWA2_61_42]OGR75737.1 MAG: NUDIX hydrolase [Elusimicrobia bacterium GWC2_61_25]